MGLSEYEGRVREFLTACLSLAASLESDAPNARSYSFYGTLAPDLRAAVEAVSLAYSQGASRSELALLANGIKKLVDYISASETKGEIPLGKPELLNRVMSLMYVFQELCWSEIP